MFSWGAVSFLLWIVQSNFSFHYFPFFFSFFSGFPFFPFSFFFFSLFCFYIFISLLLLYLCFLLNRIFHVVSCLVFLFGSFSAFCFLLLFFFSWMMQYFGFICTGVSFYGAIEGLFGSIVEVVVIWIYMSTDFHRFQGLPAWAVDVFVGCSDLFSTRVVEGGEFYEFHLFLWRFRVRPFWGVAYVYLFIFIAGWFSVCSCSSPCCSCVVLLLFIVFRFLFLAVCPGWGFIYGPFPSSKEDSFGTFHYKRKYLHLVFPTPLIYKSEIRSSTKETDHIGRPK